MTTSKEGPIEKSIAERKNPKEIPFGPVSAGYNPLIASAFFS
jgi:hypothetical protein